MPFFAYVNNSKFALLRLWHSYNFRISFHPIFFVTSFHIWRAINIWDGRKSKMYTLDLNWYAGSDRRRRKYFHLQIISRWHQLIPLLQIPNEVIKLQVRKSTPVYIQRWILFLPKRHTYFWVILETTVVKKIAVNVMSAIIRACKQFVISYGNIIIKGFHFNCF